RDPCWCGLGAARARGRQASGRRATARAAGRGGRRSPARLRAALGRDGHRHDRRGPRGARAGRRERWRSGRRSERACRADPRSLFVPSPDAEGRGVTAPAPPDLQLHELGSRVRRGLAWKLISQVSLQGSRFVVTVALARILTPHDFGIAGMVLVLSSFIIPFADLGMGAAIVQRPSIDDRDRSTLFWTSIAAGGLFTGIGIVVAHWVGDFYGQPAVATLFAVLSTNFLITALGSTHRSLLMRAMDFRSLELRFLVGVAAGAVVGIGVALAGFGPWALVAQELAVAAV